MLVRAMDTVRRESAEQPRPASRVAALSDARLYASATRISGSNPPGVQRGARMSAVEPCDLTTAAVEWLYGYDQCVTFDRTEAGLKACTTSRGCSPSIRARREW